MSNQFQNPNQIRENKLSICRPAWTSDDMCAFRHLHLQKKIVQNHFIEARGFASKRDLKLVENQ